MLCRRPFNAGSLGFGCGQCIPCRVNRRRVWAARLQLESFGHDASCFVTLTYSEDHLPVSGSLVPRDLQLFLKRLRKAVSPARLRFFAVGEYGPQTFRPHYHAALFGLGPLSGDVVRDAWGLGFTQTVELNAQTANYVAGYCMKKIGDHCQAEARGLHREFGRMSNRPGIGALAMLKVAEALDTRFGRLEVEKLGDVPHALATGKRSLPLGRYLRDRLRKEVGLTDDQVQAARDAWSLEASAEVCALLLRARGDGAFHSFSTVTLARDLQRLRQVEARAKLQPMRTL